MSERAQRFVPMSVAHPYILEAWVCWKRDAATGVEAATRELRGVDSERALIEHTKATVKTLAPLFFDASHHPEYIHIRVLSKEDPREPRLVAEIVLMPDYREDKVDVWWCVLCGRRKLRQELQRAVQEALVELGGAMFYAAEVRIPRVRLGEELCTAT